MAEVEPIHHRREEGIRDLVANLVDTILPKVGAGTEPTVDESFYAAWDRMVKARSKRALPRWYRSTAIQQIRPVEALQERTT